MMSSAVLVQAKGSQRSFQPSMTVSMAAMRSLTLVKVPRRMAWRVMIPKKISTRFSQVPKFEGNVGALAELDDVAVLRPVGLRPGERQCCWSHRTPDLSGSGGAGSHALVAQTSGHDRSDRPDWAVR